MAILNWKKNLACLAEAHNKKQKQKQKRAAGVGFDWPSLSGALDKIEEEVAEVREAANLHDHAALQGELGDLLFALVLMNSLRYN